MCRVTEAFWRAAVLDISVCWIFFADVSDTCLPDLESQEKAKASRITLTVPTYMIQRGTAGLVSLGEADDVSCFFFSFFRGKARILIDSSWLIFGCPFPTFLFSKEGATSGLLACSIERKEDRFSF